jgi:hypothetical protein
MEAVVLGHVLDNVLGRPTLNEVELREKVLVLIPLLVHYAKMFDFDHIEVMVKV